MKRKRVVVKMSGSSCVQKAGLDIYSGRTSCNRTEWVGIVQEGLQVLLSLSLSLSERMFAKLEDCGKATVGLLACVQARESLAN